jgi:hypothetical protein
MIIVKWLYDYSNKWHDYIVIYRLDYSNLEGVQT